VGDAEGHGVCGVQVDQEHQSAGKREEFWHPAGQDDGGAPVYESTGWIQQATFAGQGVKGCRVAGYSLLVTGVLEMGRGYASFIHLDRARSWIMLAGSLCDWRCTGQGRLCELHTCHEAIGSNTRSICVSNISLHDESALPAVLAYPWKMMRVGCLALEMASETMRITWSGHGWGKILDFFARMYVDTQPKTPDFSTVHQTWLWWHLESTSGVVLPQHINICGCGHSSDPRTSTSQSADMTSAVLKC
jgi:hypothetical protein